MQRTISAMVGKGSTNHNSRKFKAINVDGTRTQYNIEYCNENIRQVYHQLFDEAVAAYNAKQTRKDRMIADYYEKIRSGKQEKPFHELIIQIGDKDTMGAESDDGQKAREMLDEYFQGFQKRNPNLRVFSAHLHMDEATPHLHIDFVPFTTGSTRGLETRVSLKQALAAQGFGGGTRGDTEWNQWVRSEKEAVAVVMERHGIQWEQKGTHEKHLSVLDFEKKKRTEELKELDQQVHEKQDEIEVLAQQAENYQAGLERLSVLENLMETPEYQLPEIGSFSSAKAYRGKVAEPVVQRLKALVEKVIGQLTEAYNRYYRVCKSYEQLKTVNQDLTVRNEKLREENQKLTHELKDYRLLKRCLGKTGIAQLLEQARAKQTKTREENSRY